jgi:menaquinol-cytochrome c reductase iron-sulfur subunit
MLGAAMAAVVAVPAAAYLLLKPKSSSGDNLVEVADLADLPTGTPQEVVYYRTRIDGWKRSREKATAWVVKTAEEKAIAFSPTCPHLGCIYHWEAERGEGDPSDSQGQPTSAFVCPCHASSFSAQGEVLGGPAPRPLDRYVTRIEGGKLLVGSQIEKA